jgi:hypothetical protein
VSDEDAEVDLGDYSGYDPPALRGPYELEVGDLVELDEGSGIWVTVDEEAEPDPSDPTAVAVSWRDDQDDTGVLCLPDTSAVPSRRPLTSPDDIQPNG